MRVVLPSKGQVGVVARGSRGPREGDGWKWRRDGYSERDSAGRVLAHQTAAWHRRPSPVGKECAGRWQTFSRWPAASILRGKPAVGCGRRSAIQPGTYHEKHG